MSFLLQSEQCSSIDFSLNGLSNLPIVDHHQWLVMIDDYSINTMKTISTTIVSETIIIDLLQTLVFQISLQSIPRDNIACCPKHHNFHMKPFHLLKARYKDNCHNSGYGNFGFSCYNLRLACLDTSHARKSNRFTLVLIYRYFFLIWISNVHSQQ